MTYPTSKATSRRRFLKTSGTMVAMIPVVNLVGCSDDQSQPASQSTESPQQPAQQTKPQPAQEQQAASEQRAPAEPAERPEMVKLEESDPTAQSLAYVHDAGDVDAAQQSRYEEGQNCANCSLYTADSSSEEDWGGCAIFPGKLVNANGWCSAYVPAG
ncbi:MAG: high-potential iron-sulfur protein [Gammaproteobacteria bacterium]|nr:high-potential iron-sulfur protein [Gammaproteobacteria bacterium]